MDSDNFKKMEEAQRFLDKNYKYLQNNYGSISHDRYLSSFMHLRDVSMVGIISPFLFEEKILSNYKEKVVSVKGFGQPQGPLCQILVQDDVYNHYIMNAVLTSSNKEPFIKTVLSVSVFAKNSPTSLVAFTKKNKKYIFKGSDKQLSVGFKR